MISDETNELQLLMHAPEMYSRLEAYITELPGNQHTPAYPFSGYVINVNVVTMAHRDGKDEIGCVLIVVGEHKGGELVLVEPGLVLELKNGDVLIFPSGRITHYNLHYEGTRASLVLHSDREGFGYAKDANGWKGNVYYLKVEVDQPSTP
jgi:hypothetical protein